PSLVAEIGEVLETHMKKCGLIETEELSEAHKEMIAEKRALLENGAANAENAKDPAEVSGYPEGAQLCTKCNTQAMVLMDGCMTCLSCGDSKCG
ncbi:MAG: NrdJb, partial [Pseudomonadales bacterium]|nr:NrdJb [Pseudomonadales bacterium]